MARTPFFDSVRRLLTIARHADEKSLSTDDAMGEAAAAAETAETNRLSRRRLLQSAAVASAAVAATNILPGRARAAKRSGPGSVAVVGAGMAGLTCVDTLAVKGVTATLYEAGLRAGGRMQSLGLGFPGAVDFPGQVVELGGEFIDTTHTTMKSYAQALGFATEDVRRESGSTFYAVGSTLYSEAEVVAEFRDLVDAMRDDLRNLSNGPTATSFTPFDRSLDLMTLRHYLASRGAGPLITAILDSAYTGEYGREIDQQSALNFLFFAKADNRSKFKPFGIFSDERYHLVGGNEQIPRALAQTYDDRLEYGAWLQKVERLSSGRYRLHFRSSDGLTVWGPTWSADHDSVVLALPFSVLRTVELHSSLGLPATKTNAINNFGYGTNSKLMVGFTSRPWNNYGGTGALFAKDIPYVLNTWETNYVNGDANRAVLTDYTGGALGLSLDPSQASRDAGRFVAGLERVWPGISNATRKNGNTIRAVTRNWSLVPTARGSYTSNAPGYFTTIAGHEATPVGRLFFAGEHTDSFYEWQGFMEGAANSGIRAALEVVRG